MTYLTGSYRLLNFRNFPSNIGIGLFLDLFANGLPMILLQAVNNATLSDQDIDSVDVMKFSGLQKICILLNAVLVVAVIVEFFIFCIEIYKLHKLET